MSPRPFLILKKVFSNRKEDPKTTCRQTTSVRSTFNDSTRCSNAKITHQGDIITREDSHALGALYRWEQVSCPEVFKSYFRADNEAPHRNTAVSSNCLHQFPVDLRTASSPANNSGQEFSQTIHCLTEEVQQLKDQVRSLQKLCHQRDQKIQEYEHKIEDAWMVAQGESCKSKTAKEVIRDLKLRIRLISEKVVPDLEGKDHPSRVLRNFSRSSGLMKDRKAYDSCTSSIILSNIMNSPYERDHCGATEMAENSVEMNPLNHERIEQYQTGVYITLSTTSGGQKELKRVRFSRKRYSEEEAQRWWDENQLRVYQYYDMDE